MDVQATIFSKLDDMGIDYDCTSHPEAHTMADCRTAEEALHALMPKNLFLTPRNRSAFYLCLTMPDAVFRTASISKQIGSSRLSFAGPDDLFCLLSTVPGAISHMGLLFDSEKKVSLLIDKAITGYSRLAFHPNDAGKSLAMSKDDFLNKFLKTLGYEPIYVDI